MNNLEFSIQPICEACVHFQMESEREIDPDLNEVNPQTMFCKSFPAGIPIEIWQDANPHFRPVGGEKEEGGKPILFKAVEGRRRQKHYKRRTKRRRGREGRSGCGKR